MLRTAGLLMLPLVQAAAQPTQVPRSALVTAVEALADSLARADRFSGVVLLARDGTPIFRRAWGMADRDAGRPNDFDTRFNLGSINKVFTATAIRQLVAQGKLELDGKLIQYWPDYPNRDVAQRVTIRQLLQHTAGLGGDIFGDPPGGTRDQLRRNDDFVQLFAGQPLVFEPGSQRRYSNAGYVVLGQVIARISGMDYYEYVRRNVFRPAGMIATDWYAKDSLPPNTAIGYTHGGPGADVEEPLHRNTELLPGRGSAAGGGYSTAGDLLKLATAMAAGTIPGAPRGGLGAAGGTAGVNALLETGLPGGYTLAILANMDPPVAERIGERVRTLLGVKDEGPPPPARPSPPRQ